MRTDAVRNGQLLADHDHDACILAGTMDDIMVVSNVFHSMGDSGFGDNHYLVLLTCSIYPVNKFMLGQTASVPHHDWDPLPRRPRRV